MKEKIATKEKKAMYRRVPEEHPVESHGEQQSYTGRMFKKHGDDVGSSKKEELRNTEKDSIDEYKNDEAKENNEATFPLRE